MVKDAVVASALELVEVAEVEALSRAGASRQTFSAVEEAYARSKRDPARRLAARLAAKRAAARLLGEPIGPEDVEVRRSPGFPPSLHLSPRGQERLHALGAARTMVSLTHGVAYAAAAVLLIRDPT